MAATPDAYTDTAGALRMDSWASRAACIGKADILACRTLLPSGQRDENPARVMCAACPVEAECRDTVLALPYQADPEDMWIVGGLNYRQRVRERRRRAALAAAVKRRTRRHAASAVVIELRPGTRREVAA